MCRTEHQPTKKLDMYLTKVYLEIMKPFSVYLLVMKVIYNISCHLGILLLNLECIIFLFAVSAFINLN